MNLSVIVLIAWLVFITAVWIYLAKKIFKRIRLSKEKAKKLNALMFELNEIQKRYNKTTKILMEMFVPQDVLNTCFEPLINKIEHIAAQLEDESKSTKKRNPNSKLQR